MIKKKSLSFINNILEKYTEVVPEVEDNGLVEDAPVIKKENSKKDMIVEQMEKGANKVLAVSNKVQETVKSSFSDDSSKENNSLSKLLTTTPETEVEDKVLVEEVIEKEVDAPKVIEAKPVDSYAMSKEEVEKQAQFDKNLALGDEIIEGFTDTCLDTVEGIQRNTLLSNERKMEKIAQIEDEFLSIKEDDIDSLIVFFKKMHHQHHMLENKVGEYDERVYENGLINDARIMNYDIIGLHMDDELYHYESRDDKNAINKLLDMAEEIHRRANACGCLDKYLKETENLLMTCHTRLDIDVVEEKFDSMLMDLNVKINMSNNTLIG